MGSILTIGESLLRLSTQVGRRLNDSKEFIADIGGAESNVAINLAQLEHQVKYATKVPNNPLGKKVFHRMVTYGIDCSEILYGDGRLGIYYFEPGSGIRAGSVEYDRAYSSIAMMQEIEWDYDSLFEKIELLHITGTTLALSEFWHIAGVELIKEAKRRNIRVSFDMNYRSKLWDYQTAKNVYQQVLPYVDYLSASYLDMIHFMDIPLNDMTELEKGLTQVKEHYPNIQKIYGTKRELLSANSYRLLGYVYDADLHQYVESKQYVIDQVIDRIGAGDSYAAGVLDGIVLGKNNQEMVDFAIAMSALKHTLLGDVNLCTRFEIEQVMNQTINIYR